MGRQGEDEAPGHLLARLGVEAAQRGDLPEAERLLERAVRVAPGLAQAHNNLGNLRLMQGRPDEAIALYRRATRLDPGNAKAHFNLGAALTRAGDLEEAAESYRRSIALEPDRAEAHERLGAVRRRQGRLEEAALGFGRALELDPSRAELGHLVSAYRGETTRGAQDAYVAYLFDNLADTFDHDLVDGLGYRTPATLSRMIFGLLGEAHRFGRVLDLGCGTGLSGREFAGRADEIVGVDLSEKMLGKARARGVYHRLEHAGIRAFLEREEATFDLFLAADVFVYTGDLEPTFGLVRRRSAPGACFLFSTELGETGDYVLNPTGRYAHATAYIERIAAAAGFVRLLHERHTVRCERDEPVIGDCFLLRAG